MRKVLLVAGFSIREAFSRKVVLVLLAAALGILALFGVLMAYSWGDMLRESGTQAAAEAQAWGGTRAVLPVLNGLVVLTAVFLAASGISSEAENGSLHVLLPRPVTRSQFFLGKLVAFGAVILGFSLVLTSGVAAILAAFGPGWPPGWHWAMLGFGLEAVLMVAGALLLSTRFSFLTAGILGLLLYVLAQVGQGLEAIGGHLGSAGTTAMGIMISMITPVDVVYRWAIDRWMDALGPAGALTRMMDFPIAAPSGWMMLWGLGWFVAAVLLGLRSMTTREL